MIAEEAPRLGDVEQGGVRVLPIELGTPNFQALAEAARHQIEGRLGRQRIGRTDEEDLEAADFFESEAHCRCHVGGVGPAPESAGSEVCAALALSGIVRYMA